MPNDFEPKKVVLDGIYYFGTIALAVVVGEALQLRHFLNVTPVWALVLALIPSLIVWGFVDEVGRNTIPSFVLKHTLWTSILIVKFFLASAIVFRLAAIWPAIIGVRQFELCVLGMLGSVLLCDTLLLTYFILELHKK